MAAVEDIKPVIGEQDAVDLKCSPFSKVRSALVKKPKAGPPKSRSTREPKEPFHFKDNVLNEFELAAAQEYVKKNLGADPSSKHFVERKKAIAFLFILEGNIYSLEQAYFIQPDSYNDFSGGYKRHYTKIPDEFIQTTLRRCILDFAKTYNIPEMSLFLLQLQTSLIPADAPKSRGRGSITGQGIHTDGANRAMLACILRSNVEGAYNNFYTDLAGQHPLCGNGVALQEGNGVYFKDDTIFHYVCPAGPENPEQEMERAMMLLHWPADFTLTGRDNKTNTQGANKAARRATRIGEPTEERASCRTSIVMEDFHLP